MKQLFIVICFCSLAFIVQGQIPQFTVQEAIDRIYDFLTEDDAIVDYDGIYQTLQELSQHKINLNNTTPEAMSALLFLSDQQVENFFYYHYRVGSLQSLYELQLVDGFDNFTIALMLPFVELLAPHVEPTPLSFKEIWNHGVHAIDGRFDGSFPKRKGYSAKTDSTAPAYLGAPLGGMVRYRFSSSNRLWFGVSGEQDAGEPFWGSYRRGFDSYHIYLQYHGVKWLKRFVLGDFRAGFGQGLVFGSAFRTGKSGEVLPSAVSELGMRRMASLTEYLYLRGVGATFQVGKVDVTTFYSIQQMDADTIGGSFSTFKTDGYHRTLLEQSKRNTVWRQALGVHVDYDYALFQLGATLYGALLNVPIVPTDKPYNRYAFRGKMQGAASVDYRFRWRMLQFWGETALNQEAAVATLNALEVSPVSMLTLTLLYRYYSPRYNLFFAQGFSENGSVTNEQGLYVGMRFTPLPAVRLTAYADLFAYPWLRYGTKSPTAGYDLFLQSDWIITSDLILQGRVRYRQKEDFETTELVTPEVVDMGIGLLRIDLIYLMGEWNFRSYVQGTLAKEPSKSTTYGWMLMQEATWRSNRLGLSCSGRFELFQADDYANRLYCLERNIPTYFYTPALYGTGCRYYLLLSYRWQRYLTLSARFAQTRYFDGRTTIGSGNDQITGSLRTDFQIYMLWQIPNKRQQKRNGYL